jgi:hypothetical protein
MILVRSGRETSSEYKPCWPVKGFALPYTGLYTISNVYKVGLPAEA